MKEEIIISNNFQKIIYDQYNNNIIFNQKNFLYHNFYFKKLMIFFPLIGSIFLFIIGSIIISFTNFNQVTNEIYFGFQIFNLLGTSILILIAFISYLIIFKTLIILNERKMVIISIESYPSIINTFCVGLVFLSSFFNTISPFKTIGFFIIYSSLFLVSFSLFFTFLLQSYSRNIFQITKEKNLLIAKSSNYIPLLSSLFNYDLIWDTNTNDQLELFILPAKRTDSKNMFVTNSKRYSNINYLALDDLSNDKNYSLFIFSKNNFNLGLIGSRIAFDLTKKQLYLILEILEYQSLCKIIKPNYNVN